MFDALMLAWSSFCIAVAPSSMLVMCPLLRAVFIFGWPPLINEVHAAVALDRFEVFKRVCTHDMCLKFWPDALNKSGACCVRVLVPRSLFCRIC